MVARSFTTELLPRSSLNLPDSRNRVPGRTNPRLFMNLLLASVEQSVEHAFNRMSTKEEKL